MNDDTLLIDKFLEGDDTAFEKLIEKYRRMIYGLSYRMLGSAEFAEDVTQQVFIKVFQNVSKFKRKSSFKTWIYAITMNECRATYRKLSKDTEASDDVLPADDRDTPEETYTLEESKKILKDAMGKLPFKQKAVVALRINEELSFKEISRTMGISVNAAKVNFQHGFNKLKEAIGS
ncbi:MAG: sigma-70 family RNA polymerase sigma factor [Acidobacteria bacterium]|nr:sigma-70 family RNA polymerase sigma factor [Acidobacteriota bacterium]